MKRLFMPCLLLVGSGMLLPASAHGQTLQKAPELRQGVVFVVNGSGDDSSVSDTLGVLIGKRRLPLSMYTLRWCRQAGPFKDHCDLEAQIIGARRLASWVVTYRNNFPHENIYLIAHSGGTHVVLLAAGMLPPNCVDRIIIMGTSVSPQFDLRPALRSSRQGLDSLYTENDIILDVASENFKTADRRTGPTAGQVGFVFPPPYYPDACLYGKLRQLRWDPKMICKGHFGGHFGFVHECFMNAYVVPMLCPQAPAYSGPSFCTEGSCPIAR